MAALCGIRLAQVRRAEWVLAACGFVLVLVPAIESVLPEALSTGLSHAHVGLSYWYVLLAAAVAACCWVTERTQERGLAVALIGICVTAAVVHVIWFTAPVLDNTVSARGFARAHGAAPNCETNPSRGWRYGLDYYFHHPIPDCK
jgi:amino acid permease